MRKLLMVMKAFIVANALLLSQGLAADTTTIAAFGDSLFAGLGVGANEAFPARLEQRLQEKGHNVKVLNFGISGDTTAGGVARVAGVVQQKPDLVLLELGANDLLRGIQPAVMKENLNAIMGHLRQANIPMLLIGQQAPFTLGAPYANAYNTVFPDLAAAYGVQLYPVFLEGVYGNPALMQPDGVHPNKDGVEQLVSNLLPWVEQQLTQ